MRSSLFVNRKAPYSSQATKEALDAALASAAFGVPVGILFMADGVYQLKASQDPNPQQLKRTAPIFQSLSLYDIQNLYVAKNDLDQRGLCPEDLMIKVTLVDDQQIAGLFSHYDNVLTF
jgi:tRNA 2-thiouridine synthesizing protein C